jgi:two-component system chemotaxis response regulator CheB
MKTPVRTLIIDDSALARDVLKKGLSRDPEIEVVGTAQDPYIGRDKIVYKKPDVVTLDIEMPRMDGLDFLRRLMPQYPIPVIIVSALAAPGARATLEALQLGAVDFVLKPSSKIGTGLRDMLEELKSKIKMASTVDVSKWKSKEIVRRKSPKILVGSSDKVIVIGASTGGTVALRHMIDEFPADMPGTVVVQHMPETFTRLFAESLNKTSTVDVKEAEDGDRILTGRVLVAPGGMQLQVTRSGGEYRVKIYPGEKVNGHAPSVDTMFSSAADNAGPNAIGVLLTGMGRDGADGMLRMRKAGGRAFAQDEKSSVVFGMPKEAYANGGAERLVPIEDMARVVVTALKDMK